MTKPVILIAGNPDWLGDIQNTLDADYAIITQTEPDGYMNAIIDSRPALVIVDGERDDWTRWTTSPKSSAATRRVPILLVSANPDVRYQAATKGADKTLDIADFLRNPSREVDAIARVMPDEIREQLDCDCEEPLPPLAVEGVQKFNAGEYYRQHDLFEEQWVNTERPVRDLYRAILQVGVAYYQIERGNYRGALKMLQRSVQWLSILPDVCQGVDVQQLREDSARVRAELERLGEAQFSEFDRTLIQPVKLISESDESLNI